MAVWTVIDHQEMGASSWSPSGSTTLTEWDKSSIPTDGTYDHLYLVVSARTDASVFVDQWGLRFNGDTLSNYSSTFIYTNTSGAGTPLAGRGSNQAAIQFLYGATGASAGAGNFGVMTLWVPNFAGAVGFKSCFGRWSGTNDTSTNGEWMVGTAAGLWNNTAAIDQITLIDVSADDFVRYSSVTLYGIKGV